MLESYSREFIEIINEAEQLKHDLNIMMENVVDLSRSLVDEIDAKVNDSLIIEDEVLQDDDINENKLRVYELAQELEMDSGQLLAILTGLGFDYNSHMNTLDDNTVQIIKSFLNANKKEDGELSFIKSVEDNDEAIQIQQIKNAHPYIAVRVLHEKGYGIKEIAKILERGQGEVSLILNLSKKINAI